MTYASPVNATRISQILVYVNEVTNNWFGNVVIIAIFIIAFAALLNRPTKEAFTVSSFITTIMAVLFFLLGILSELVLFICIFATAVGVISLFKDS